MLGKLNPETESWKISQHVLGADFLYFDGSHHIQLQQNLIETAPQQFTQEVKIDSYSY